MIDPAVTQALLAMPISKDAVERVAFSRALQAWNELDPTAEVPEPVLKKIRQFIAAGRK